MAAAMVMATGSFVSCTDREDDRIQELQYIIETQTVGGAISQQADSLEALKERLAKLEAYVQACCSTMNAKLADYVTLAQLNDTMNNCYTWVRNQNFVTLTKFNQELANYCKKDDYYTKTEITNFLSQYFTKTEINNLLLGYVTKAELATLVGPQISDSLQNYYTKDEVDALLCNCGFDPNDYYTKTQIDAFLGNKVDKGTVYTKDEVDDKLGGKADTGTVYTRDYIDKLIAKYYTKTEVDDKIKDFITKEGALAAVLEAVQDAQSDISKAIYNNVITNIRNEQFGKTGETMDLDSVVMAIRDLQRTIEDVKSKATDAYNWVEANKDDFSDMKDWIDQWKSTVETISTTYATKVELNNLAGRVDSLCNEVTSNRTFIQNVYNRTDSIISELDKHNKDLNERIDSLRDVSNEIWGKIKEDSTYLKGLIDDLDQAIKDGDAAVLQEMKDSIQSVKELMDKKFEKVIEDYQAADKALQDQLDDLKPRVETLETKVATLEEQIAPLIGLDKVVEKLNNKLNKLITSIVIQGTENPVFGEAAAPLDVQTNVLMAYYGWAPGTGVEFPTQNDVLYVSEENYNLMTAKDWEMIAGYDTYTKEAYQRLDLQQEDNAGTLYLTVNPSTVDFSGTKFSLVNSQDEEAGIQLGQLKKSNHKLFFGYSWTRGENGFYEAPAKLVNTDRTKPDADIDLQQMKDAATKLKTILSRSDAKKDKVNAQAVAKAIIQNADVKLDRYAVKATWTDDDNVEHSTVSNYNIAATAVKPLSMGWLWDYNPGRVPGIHRLENFISRMMDNVKISIPAINFTIKDFYIDDLEIVELSEDMKAKFKKDIHIDIEEDFEVNVGTITVNPNDFNLYVPDQTITIPGQEVKSYLTDATGRWVIDVNKNGMEDAGDSYVDRTDEQVVKKDPADGNTDHLYASEGGTNLGRLIRIGITIVNPTTANTGDININAQEVEVNVGKKTVHVSFHDVKSIDMTDALEQLYGDLQKPIKQVKDLIADLNDYVDDVKDLLNDLQTKYNSIQDKIDEAKNDIKGQIFKYLDLFNDKFAPYMVPNFYLRPVLLMKGDGALHRLGTSAKKPRVMTTNKFVMMPTSYTGELIAPAFKKFIAVTNVWNKDLTKSAQVDGGELKSALDAANSGELKKVIDGDRQQILFEAGSQYNGKGYTYEIAYMALDYRGKVIVSKYYVKVK